MEFHEKLQELRKQKGLTQEELAEKLYVSRAAISKWESGRGYPSIDSLKGIGKFFGVTVDALLSGEELLTVAEEEGKHKERHVRDMAFGLLDCSMALLFFAPFFGQLVAGEIQEVALINLTAIAPWLKGLYFAGCLGLLLWGIATLALQNFRKDKTTVSLLLNAAGVLLFIVGKQPYAAAYLFLLLVIKGILFIKTR